MKKLLLILITISTLFLGCSTSPTKKAEKLIMAKSGSYIEKPTYTFDNEVEPIIDKKLNSVIGYYLIYEIEIGGDIFMKKAKFDKDITIIIDEKIMIDERCPYEREERIDKLINR